MAAQIDGSLAFTYRLALEALRNGVPNGEAVRLLGCNQPHAEARFEDMLTKSSDADNPPTNSLGMLVSGDFGTGKSHLLTHLEHVALSQGFVCSKVAISKETPLYDLGKVFKSAVENGRMPDRSGRLIEELGQALKPDSEEYAAFFHWANDSESNRLSQMFPASLIVHERSRNLELNGEIESFWGGDRIKISSVKDGLRQIGQLQNYPFRAPKAAELPPQRLRFTIELIKGAGYKGWAVLLDEVELIGSYSLLQRGRSYAELTRWMGQVAGETYPGLVVVGTVTDDFPTAVIGTDGKQDRDYVGPQRQCCCISRGNRHEIDRTGSRSTESPERCRCERDRGQAAGHLQRRLRLGCPATGRKGRWRRTSGADALQSPGLHQRVGLVAPLPGLPP